MQRSESSPPEIQGDGSYGNTKHGAQQFEAQGWDHLHRGHADAGLHRWRIESEQAIDAAVSRAAARLAVPPQKTPSKANLTLLDCVGGLNGNNGVDDTLLLRCGQLAKAKH